MPSGKGMASNLKPFCKTQILSFQNPSKEVLRIRNKKQMANLHIRSNSLPSRSHPVINDVEDHLGRLKSSEGTSTSATSISANLASLKDLHESVNNLVQMPSIQQGLTTEGSKKWINELLEESLGLLDLCGFVQEVLSLTKGSVQELQSSIRRSRVETATADEYNAYMVSRKKINKMVNKFLVNFKSFNRNRPVHFDGGCDLKAVSEILKETAAFDFSVLKSALILLSGEKGRSKKMSWSLLSIFTRTSHAADVRNVSEHLKSSEVIIQELEEELETFYRTLLKSRVSLLNALNN